MGQHSGRDGQAPLSLGILRNLHPHPNSNSDSHAQSQSNGDSITNAHGDPHDLADTYHYADPHHVANTHGYFDHYTEPHARTTAGLSPSHLALDAHPGYA